MHNWGVEREQDERHTSDKALRMLMFRGTGRRGAESISMALSGGPAEEMMMDLPWKNTGGGLSGVIPGVCFSSAKVVNGEWAIGSLERKKTGVHARVG